MASGCVQGLFLLCGARQESSRRQSLGGQQFQDKPDEEVQKKAGAAKSAVEEDFLPFNRCPSTGSTASCVSDIGSICYSSCSSTNGDESGCESESCIPSERDLPPMLPLVLPRTLRVRVCSWNLFGQGIHAKDDPSWWLRKGVRTDLLVIGVQEIIEMRPLPILMHGHGDPQRQAALEKRIEAAMGNAGARFVKVCNFSMGGLAMLVYVRSELASTVRDLRYDEVKTGFGGLASNKGGITVHLTVGELSTCFTNVHLPSGQGKAEKRDRHLSKVLSRSTASRGTTSWDSALRTTLGTPAERMLPPQHLSVVFGDFNSRLELKAGSGQPQEPSQALMQHDELKLGRYCCLRGFREGHVEFPPTFRYVPGTAQFSSRGPPAWCDRAVFKAGAGAQAEVLEYGSFDELRHTSDHRPIAAQILVGLPKGPVGDAAQSGCAPGL